MSHSDRLQKVTVLGAAGKMGSGIVILTALEMADLLLESGTSAPGTHPVTHESSPMITAYRAARRSREARER